MSVRHIVLTTLVAMVLLNGRTTYGWVWGVADSPDSPTNVSLLFKFNENNFGSGNMILIGNVEVDGVGIEVDGLAVYAPSQPLYGFEMTGSGSQLVAIGPNSGKATRIGGIVTPNTISGASFDPAGNLWALETISDTPQTSSTPTNGDPNTGTGNLLRIDPTTGNILQTIALTPPPVDEFAGASGYSGMLWIATSDIAFDLNGNLWLISQHRLYAGGGWSSMYGVNLTTGDMTIERLPYISQRGAQGLAFSFWSLDDPGTASVDESTTAFYHATTTNGIYRLNPATNFGLAGTYIADGTPDFNFRGFPSDLAAMLVPEPATLTLLAAGMIVLSRRKRA